jgi:hypothetical protein
MRRPRQASYGVWVTVNVCPAIVIVPDRLLPLEFDPTLNPTVPLPVPAAPNAMVSHGVVVVAVHAQPVLAVTATDLGPPAAAMDVLVGLIEYVHVGGGGAAAD